MTFEIFSGLVNTCFFCFVIPPLPLRLPRIKSTPHPPVRRVPSRRYLVTQQSLLHTSIVILLARKDQLKRYCHPPLHYASIQPPAFTFTSMILQRKRDKKIHDFVTKYLIYAHVKYLEKSQNKEN